MALKPAYRLTIGGKVVDTTDEPRASTVVDLTVRLDLDTPADSFTLALAEVNGLQPKRDDDAKIELGYADNGGLTQVMAGTILAVEPGLTITRIVGQSAATALLRMFVDQTYESKTAGQIVRDLADQAGVDVTTAEDGITFPAYVVHSRRAVFHHMADLAELCGFDLYLASDDKLLFEKFTAGKVIHVFDYAKQIVQLEVQQVPARVGRVEAWGESPGGGRGEEAWAWLTKDFSGSKGTAGQGEPLLRLERPALRTADASRTAATAALSAITRKSLRGRLETPGRPQVKLGDAIRLRDVPEADLNTTFQVRNVTHRITKTGGFTTTISFRSLA
jgi:phage protein D